jgi:L-Ala-D/L-Glu epimerase
MTTEVTSQATASTIARIEAIPFRIPLRQSIAWKQSVETEAEHVLVRVTDEDGCVGVAEAIPRPTIHGETTASVLAACDLVRPVVVGRQAWERPVIVQQLDAALVANHTAKGAIDCALADLWYRRLGVSCHRSFGGYADSLPISQTLGFGAPAEVAAEARALRDEHGIAAFRIKVGRDVAADADTVRRIRREQPDALLYADANHGYNQLEALRFARIVGELDLAWFEEPVPADQVVARERVASICGVSIYGDESCTTPREVGREVLAGRTHVVCLKLARMGFAGGERVRGFCETVGAPIVMGSQGESSIGVLAGMAFGAAYPSTSQYPAEYGFLLRLTDDLVVDPVRIVNGRIHVDPGVGTGAVIDEDKLSHYRID